MVLRESVECDGAARRRFSEMLKTLGWSGRRVIYVHFKLFLLFKIAQDALDAYIHAAALSRRLATTVAEATGRGLQGTERALPGDLLRDMGQAQGALHRLCARWAVASAHGTETSPPGHRRGRSRALRVSHPGIRQSHKVLSLGGVVEGLPLKSRLWLQYAESCALWRHRCTVCGYMSCSLACISSLFLASFMTEDGVCSGDWDIVIHLNTTGPSTSTADIKGATDINTKLIPEVNWLSKGLEMSTSRIYWSGGLSERALSLPTGGLIDLQSLVYAWIFNSTGAYDLPSQLPRCRCLDHLGTATDDITKCNSSQQLSLAIRSLTPLSRRCY